MLDDTSHGKKSPLKDKVESLHEGDGESLDEIGRKLVQKKEPPLDSSELSSKLTPLPYKQEETRSWLARRLVNMLIGTIIGTFLLIVVDKILITLDENQDNQTSRELITLLWTSQATLVGSALGFYFGNQKSDKSD